MPCNSDYLNATNYEVELSKVACLLDELDGKAVPSSSGYWRGYHPRVYGRITNELGDKLVSELCERLQNEDVTRHSLEMQIWWRDHLDADKKRVD